MTKGGNKPSAKKAKAKPKPPEVPPEEPPVEKVLRFVARGYQLPRAMADLQAGAERYHHSRMTTQQLAEGRALIDRMTTPPTPTQTPTPPASPTPTLTPAPPPPLSSVPAPVAPSAEAKPQQELCWRVFDQMFTDGRMPDKVELNTERLRINVATYLVNEAKAAGNKLPTKLPQWEAVNNARKTWRLKR